MEETRWEDDGGPPIDEDDDLYDYDTGHDFGDEDDADDDLDADWMEW